MKNKNVMEDEKLTRRARQVLRKLSAGAKLLHLDSQHYGLRVQGSARNALRVERHLVDAFIARDWIRGSPIRGYGLSDAGRGWLERAGCHHGSPFLAQHRKTGTRIITDDHGIERSVEVNDAESPLAWLKRRRLIDGMQFEAGETLRRDFTLARLEPRLGIDLQAPVVLGGVPASGDFSDMVMAAKQRFAAALKALGPGLADLLFDVCCHLTPLEGIERQQGWPQRSAKVVLRIALDRLGEHYGLCTTAPPRADMRQWAAEGNAA